MIQNKEKYKEKCKEKLLRLNIQMSGRMEEQFFSYYQLLLKWNKVMNLTAITLYDEVLEKHFVDSAALGAYMDLDQELKVIDVGTGAGFPGIPLKILFPKLEILLADSVNKKIKFLNEVIQQLGLTHISAVHGRAEELAQKSEYREQFDLSVSRAVADLSILSEYCIPFIKKGGVFISYKSGNIEAEAEESQTAVSVLGGKLREIQKFQLPETDYQRSLVIIDKIESTPDKYPRKAGMPVKKPIN